MPATTPGTEHVLGSINIHPRGFGFFAPKDAPKGDNAFVPPPELNAFLSGDIVRAKVNYMPDGRANACELVLEERTRERLFGEVINRKDSLWLKVDREVANTDWPLICHGEQPKPGENVVARIDGNRAILEKVIPHSVDIALERVVARHALRDVFSQDVLDDAQQLAERAHSLGARRDLRDIPTITVDAASTRDIDDAISVLPAASDGAVRLFVSIADVSAFVEPDSAVDREARARGTSVYLGKRVLPMIPEVLSASALSLLPKQERSCLTVEMRIDPEGKILSIDVYESLIRSWARVTYDEVAQFLDKGEISESLECVKDAMPWFRTLSARLAVARSRRGGVEVTREETEIVLDSQTGEAAAVAHLRATDAHKMIERFMVAANEAIARWLFERGVPTLYRVHEQPGPQQVADLDDFAMNFGFTAGFGRYLTPLALAAFDAQLNGAPCEPAIRSVLLRSLGWARYTVHPSQHFGLGASLYLHFTSPIRRYADLIVHRTVKRYLAGERPNSPEDQSVEDLATHINRMGRAASRAEADRRRMLEAQFLSSQIGKEFKARVTAVRPFGMQVQIDSSFIEGIVPFDGMPGGPWWPDHRATRAEGKYRSYGIGAPLMVRVSSTDTALGRVEFSLVDG